MQGGAAGLRRCALIAKGFSVSLVIDSAALRMRPYAPHTCENLLIAESTYTRRCAAFQALQHAHATSWLMSRSAVSCQQLAIDAQRRVVSLPSKPSSRWLSSAMCRGCYGAGKASPKVRLGQYGVQGGVRVSDGAVQGGENDSEAVISIRLFACFQIWQSGPRSRWICADRL